jgi:hypothetical protein
MKTGKETILKYKLRRMMISCYLIMAIAAAKSSGFHLQYILFLSLALTWNKRKD